MSQDLHHSDHEFVGQAKGVLDRAVGEVDHATALRLQQGRLAALDARARRSSWRTWASGLAVASLAALARAALDTTGGASSACGRAIG